MKTLELKTRFGTIEEVRIEISSYQINGGIYIGLTSLGGEFEEPYGDVTVNLGGDAIEYCGHLDTNHLPELEKFITENGIGEFTGFTKRSGFHEYPYYVFNARRLHELCPDGIIQYERSLKEDKKENKKVEIRQRTGR